MRVLGIDTSSKCSGHAMVIDGELDSWAVWKPTKTEEKVGGRVQMWSYWRWLNAYMGLRRNYIDMVVIEELAVMRGAKVARLLAKYENVAEIAAMRNGLMVTSVKAGVARNLVLGLPVNVSKEDMFKELKKQYPDMKLPPKNSGGMDVGDAFVQAKAGPIHVGRR